LKPRAGRIGVFLRHGNDLMETSGAMEHTVTMKPFSTHLDEIAIGRGLVTEFVAQFVVAFGREGLAQCT
jgi:hypothetical protein